jgi:methionyl-tRNA formyltransferase
VVVSVRLVFLGSPAFALPSLAALRAAGHTIDLVITQPDRPAGRGQKPTPPPVAAYAFAAGLPVWQTSTLSQPEAVPRLRAVGADGMVLAAFAALVPEAVLELTPHGIYNVHPSLLPRWRGASPIQAALLAGDPETGVSIMRLVAALDAGPVYSQVRVPIAPADDYLALEPRLAELGAAELVNVLATQPAPWPQPVAGVTFAPRIARDDARIDWSRSAVAIWGQVRAYRGWPQAFTRFNGQHLKVLAATPTDAADGPPGVVRLQDGQPIAATGAGGLRLDQVQLAGKRPSSGAELARGYPHLQGANLA